MKMDNLEKDIKNGLKYMHGTKRLLYGKKYYPPFYQTNEALYLYYPLFPLNEARILTVASSGDHVLEAVFRGAKDITAFDQNHFAYYMSALKIAGMKGLEWDEFMRFFAYRTKIASFQEDVYSKKIRSYLASDVQIFWDTLYDEGFEREKNKEQNQLLILDPSDLNVSSKSYLEEKNYEKTRARLKYINYHYIESELSKLPKVLDKNNPYQVMLLSNIYDWLGDIRQAYYPDFIKKKLGPYLDPNGVCVAYCMFHTDEYESWNQDDPIFEMSHCEDEKNKMIVYTYKKGNN